MALSTSKTSLRDRRVPVDLAQRRDNIHNEIKKDYFDNGKYRVTSAEQRYIMLIGRTRTGKSTIKSLIVDPTTVPNDLTLKSGTRDPLFESFHVNDNQIILNIIDTPGLFEHSNTEIDIRDNETIMRTIEICANREITKFHVVCFCVAITAGINKEDIESLKLLAHFLGDEISRNSCLIVTRCESKTDKQRDRMRAELMEDIYFKEIAHFFSLGIFFSGSLNPDDYNQGNESLYEQFFTISDYRKNLIELFTSNIQPFPISEMLISDIRRIRDEALVKQRQLEEMEIKTEELESIIQELKTARNNDQKDIEGLINRLAALNTQTGNEETHRRANCTLS